MTVTYDSRNYRTYDDLVLSEDKSEYGLARKIVSVTVESDSQIGDVLIAVGANWERIDNSTNPPVAGTKLIVLADSTVADKISTPGNYDLLVLEGGVDVILRDGALQYGDCNAANIAIAKAQLLDQRMFLTVGDSRKDQVS